MKKTRNVYLSFLLQLLDIKFLVLHAHYKAWTSERLVCLWLAVSSLSCVFYDIATAFVLNDVTVTKFVDMLLVQQSCMCCWYNCGCVAGTAVDVLLVQQLCMCCRYNNCGCVASITIVDVLLVMDVLLVQLWLCSRYNCGCDAATIIVDVLLVQLWMCCWYNCGCVGGITIVDVLLVQQLWMCCWYDYYGCVSVGGYR